MTKVYDEFNYYLETYVEDLVRFFAKRISDDLGGQEFISKRWIKSYRRS